MNYKNENKILLILDLDETLIHATKKVLKQKIDFKVFEYNIYKRPFLDEFLNKIKDDFLVAVWSSASDNYVQEVTKAIFPENYKLEFIWGKSRCTYRRNFKLDKLEYLEGNSRNHYHYIKPLQKVKRKAYSINKILIVDDSPHKCQDNYGNAIYPKEFKGDILDNELSLLSKYLMKLKDRENVRRIEKRNWKNAVL